MSGFMADFDADLARPFGMAAVGGGVLGSTIGTLQLITASGPVTPPSWARIVDIYNVGGGGGGGGGDSSYGGAAGGGGAGGNLDIVLGVPLTLGGNLSVALGAGGICGSANPGSPQTPTPGGSSSVSYGGSVISTALGGGAGANGVSSAVQSTNALGGVGGKPTAQSPLPGHTVTLGGAGGAGGNYSPYTSGQNGQNAGLANTGGIGQTSSAYPPGGGGGGASAFFSTGSGPNGGGICTTGSSGSGASGSGGNYGNQNVNIYAAAGSVYLFWRTA